MSDLIDRQEAIDALGEQPMVWTDSDYELGRQKQYDSDVSAIQNAPTIDAVRVIRCKDCRWKYGANCVRFAEVSVKADDYCSRGERKHNGKE